MAALGILVFFLCFSILAYHRASLSVWAVSAGILLVFYSAWSQAGLALLLAFWALFFIGLLSLLMARLRRRLFSKPLLNLYRKLMPTMSRTEREALKAGTVGWEGELFSGQPDWNKLIKFPHPELSEEEKAFMEGPVEALCALLDDWEITHRLADLPPKAWDLLRKEGFFGLLIPQQYGGRGFSHFACSEIQIKIQGRSVTAGTIMSTPNSLGPAELLLHYGTEEQKAYYLPKLASGEELPCFALTSPDAGSDATAMTDTGIICQGKFEGKTILGIRLNWNKRYITMAPVATVIGLAFKLFDPEHLLGDKEELGITCALIPRKTPGISIGRRHFPLNAPFQNGPIHGRDVFIPLDYIIGGPERAGQGWKMLMECLAGGRAVSLPAASTGAAKASVFATGAYSRIRRQFKLPIVRFEGVAEVVARMGCNLCQIEATRLFILGAIDRGEKPAVASAIIKYQSTEKGRLIGNDAMDIQGGKGIMLGPHNILGRIYESIPIAITVEGANILTRNMIIFGQGAMRCHPYVFAEYEAARLKNERKALKAFDKAIFSHLGYGLSNFFRTFILGLLGSWMVRAPSSTLSGYFRKATRFSSAFALLADISMLVYGKDLKRKESVSARLGDILSHLYILSSLLNYYHQVGEPEEALPVLHYACQNSLYEIRERFNELLRNPVLRFIFFPWGLRLRRTKGSVISQVAKLFSAPTETRKNLTSGIYLTPVENNNVAKMEAALLRVIEAEPIEKVIRKAAQAKQIEGRTFEELWKAALQAKLITPEQQAVLERAEAARQSVIGVDDFAPEELARS